MPISIGPCVYSVSVCVIAELECAPSKQRVFVKLERLDGIERLDTLTAQEYSSLVPANAEPPDSEWFPPVPTSKKTKAKKTKSKKNKKGVKPSAKPKTKTKKLGM